MKIAIIGGGPAGLYAAILLKKQRPQAEITVYERNRADGINSRFRDKHIDHFQPQVDLRSNKFAWMGSTKPLDAFTFIFQETEWGPFIAHAYQYEAGRSPWIFETDAETFARAGLEGLSEAQSADAMADTPTVAAALQKYEQGRREEVEKTQHAADVSLVWFEHVDRFWDFDPVQFAFGVMTRAKAITYDNLTLRAPDFVSEVDKAFAKQVRANGFDVDVDKPVAPMFQPLRLREMELANRAVVSPMCMYSAKEGVPGDFHLVHYGSRAIGGAGLIFTEMTCVGRDARITPGCTGLWNDEQEAAWRRIVDFVHVNSAAKICLQLGHAGRKGATRLMWDGMDRPLEEGGWDVLSASPIPYFPDSQVPREMDRAAMDAVKAAFVQAAERGEACGFDMLELHSAHGYLLASFISPLTNQRGDAYGGSLANRLRFPIEVFEALRAAWPSHKPMSVRISATDWAEGGITGDDAVVVARAFAEAGVDLVDVSTGQTVRDAQPIYGRMFQTPFSEQVRNEARVATMCVGNITTSDQVNTILAAGRADLVALGRPHLVDPSLTLKAAAWYGAEVACPPQYLPGKEQIFRNSVRDRQDFEDLKIKGKPKTRAELKAEATKPLAAE